jgi:hypothetical protein
MYVTINQQDPGCIDGTGVVTECQKDFVVPKTAGSGL